MYTINASEFCEELQRALPFVARQMDGVLNCVRLQVQGIALRTAACNGHIARFGRLNGDYTGDDFQVLLPEASVRLLLRAVPTGRKRVGRTISFDAEHAVFDGSMPLPWLTDTISNYPCVDNFLNKCRQETCILNTPSVHISARTWDTVSKGFGKDATLEVTTVNPEMIYVTDGETPTEVVFMTVRVIKREGE